ncbi:hypothetical protein OQI88_09310 [Lactococcus lactis]|uniref:hypothetical protein n=1 Tax=Lactococcus lactis TaxID=1358 RepID=UPI002469781C|nr:hypothetical protein [Lactococcus lactis]MDH5114683.1 hypothetical protein [Lactococcus lactis]
MDNRRKIWTERLDKQLIYAHKNGYSRKEIAELLGATFSQVDKRLTKLFREGKAERKARIFTEKDNELFHLLYQRGLPDKYIAMALDANTHTITSKRLGLGLKVNRDEEYFKHRSTQRALFNSWNYNEHMFKRVKYWEKKLGVNILGEKEHLTISQWLES